MTTTARLAAVVLGCWLLLVAGPALGQTPTPAEARKVVAKATATAYVLPDAARLTFVVTTTEGTDRSVRESNDKQVKKVKDALAALSLGKVDVDVQIVPAAISSLQSAPNPGVPPTVQGKRAESIFYVTLRTKDVDKLREAVGKIAEAAVDNGAKAPESGYTSRPFRLPVRLGGFAGGAVEPEAVAGATIEWQSSGESKARRDAIRRAVKNALADAAAAAGKDRVNVLEINVNSIGEVNYYYIRPSVQAPLVEGGRIPLRVEVTVTCTY
jgi:uncharacterized protein YggE